MITLSHTLRSTEESPGKLWEDLEEALLAPLAGMAEGDLTWMVGMEDIPAWLTEIDEFVTFTDALGNAYFQFADRSVIVPKGEMVYKRDDTVYFGERWGVMRTDGVEETVYFPEELPSV